MKKMENMSKKEFLKTINETEYELYSQDIATHEITAIIMIGHNICHYGERVPIAITNSMEDAEVIMNTMMVECNKKINWILDLNIY